MRSGLNWLHFSSSAPGRSTATSTRASGFVLSLCSPVLRAMICGGFLEGGARRLELEDVDGRRFGAVLDAWCGRAGWEAGELGELVRLAGLADRLQMAEAEEALEDVIVGRLGVETCADVVTGSRALGLRRLEEAALGMVMERFEEVAGTAGYVGLEEEVLGRVLEDEGLGVRSEERAYEGLVRWMRGGEGGLRGRGLLRAIRFGVMEDGYLATGVHGVFPEKQLKWIEGYVTEAVQARAARMRGEEVRLARLGAKGLTRRTGRGAAREWCEGDGGGRRRVGHRLGSECLAACEGSSETVEDDCVWSIAPCEGLLVSGHDSGMLTVLNAITGARERGLE